MVFSAPPFSSLSPRYHQIRLALSQRIKDGVYAGPFPMPGERELAQEFGVGRVTVRTALSRLEEEGLVIRLRGKGTVPTPRSEDQRRLPVRGELVDYLLSMGLRTKVKVLEYQIRPAPAEVARKLRLEPEAQVLKVVRIRSVEGLPISYLESYVPEEFARMLSKRALRESQMVALMEEKGIKVVSAEQTLSAAVARPGIAEGLALPEGVALLEVKRVAMDESGRRVQFSVGLYHPDRYEYHMRLSRVNGETNVWVESEQKSDTQGART